MAKSNSVMKTPLCQPAQMYLIFVIVTVVLMIVSFLMGANKMNKKVEKRVVFMMLIIAVLLQLIYGFFITGILDYLCKSGRSDWSWFIIVSMVVIVLLISMTGMKLEDLA